MIKKGLREQSFFNSELGIRNSELYPSAPSGHLPFQGRLFVGAHTVRSAILV